MSAEELIALAERVFANPEKASAWLQTSLSALDGHAPPELLDTDEGRRPVEQTLHQIDEGVYR
ncbi:DUF2384 domain-containing protein [Edaphobacter sp. HDX4]|uniref:MbcA/ParS/Xre antitoxin family protein n=1 Tax=Edaphobacter sp. HDX4 TaxID=2794064 RepID=UPI002FE59778